jgi:hypothetical protein
MHFLSLQRPLIKYRHVASISWNIVDICASKKIICVFRFHLHSLYVHFPPYNMLIHQNPAQGFTQTDVSFTSKVVRIVHRRPMPVVTGGRRGRRWLAAEIGESEN